MWFDWNILAFVVIPLQFVVFIKGSPASNAGVRERRFLGWIGYLSGVADHNRFAPIWRDWSAEVQVNIHRKHVPSEHAVLLPGYFLYTSPLSVHPHLPHTHALDNVASESAEVEAAAQSSSSGAIDGVSTDVAMGSKKKDSTHFRQFSDGKDRRTQKRGIDRRNFVELFHNSEESEEAKVEEISVEKEQNSPEISTSGSLGGDESVPSDIITTTESSVTSATDDIENISITGSNPTSESETVSTAIATEIENVQQEVSTESKESTELVEAAKQPEVHFGSYYGGQPLPNADFIFITTSDKPVPASSQTEFRPSIQYEFTNYHIEPDQHFIPIIGFKEIN